MATITYLPQCVTEDSTECYWDATQQGNGTGVSFATYGGNTHTFDVPEGTYVLDVAVSPASPTGFSVAYQEFPAFDLTPAPAYDMTLPVALVAFTAVLAIATVISAKWLDVRNRGA